MYWKNGASKNQNRSARAKYSAYLHGLATAKMQHQRQVNLYALAIERITAYVRFVTMKARPEVRLSKSKAAHCNLHRDKTTCSTDLVSIRDALKCHWMNTEQLWRDLALPQQPFNICSLAIA